MRLTSGLVLGLSFRHRRSAPAPTTLSIAPRERDYNLHKPIEYTHTIMGFVLFKIGHCIQISCMHLACQHIHMHRRKNETKRLTECNCQQWWQSSSLCRLSRLETIMGRQYTHIHTDPKLKQRKPYNRVPAPTKPTKETN